jgi:hypothetical protein
MAVQSDFLAMAMNFGAWSGKNYAGGKMNPTPREFVSLYKTVFAKGFLDLECDLGSASN